MPQANSDHLQAALHLAQRVGEHLAVLGGDRPRRARPCGALQQLAEREQHRGTPGQRRRRPLLRRPPRPPATAASTSAADGERDPAGDPAGGRVEDVAVPLRDARPTGLAVDPVASARLIVRLPSSCSGDRRGSRAPRGPRPRSASAAAPCAGTLPYRPPLPTSRPGRRVRSSTAAAAAGSGSVVPGTDQLDADHQALAADLADDRSAAVGRLRRPSRSSRARSAARCLQVVVEHVVEGRRGRGRGQRVAAEGGDRAARPGSPSGRARRDDAADREAVAEALGEGQRVRGDAVRLVAPEVLAGAAPAGLHLVADEQDPVLVEHLA